MPRKARIDAPGALHHIIGRGMDKRYIFIDDLDQSDFVERLSRIVRESGTRCLAWALVSNHFHLLLQTGNVPIATVMLRLLTGYALVFNKRHQRHGQLFQNRYKSILCQQDRYLLALIRYIHLNPLRAGLVADLETLDTHRFCGHSRLMGRIADGWQEVDDVLALFGDEKPASIGQYRRFLQKGAGMGKIPEFTGGGLVRSAGGWGVLKSMCRMNSHLKGDERILGDSGFVQQVLHAAHERYESHFALAASGCTFDRIVARVGERLGLPAEAILSPGKQPERVKARSLVAYLAVRQLGMPGTDVGKRLGVSKSAISRAVARGESLSAALSISLV